MSYDSVPATELLIKCRPDSTAQVLYPSDMTQYDTMTSSLFRQNLPLAGYHSRGFSRSRARYSPGGEQHTAKRSVNTGLA